MGRMKDGNAVYSYDLRIGSCSKDEMLALNWIDPLYLRYFWEEQEILGSFPPRAMWTTGKTRAQSASEDNDAID